jgi:hypothetical protein
MFGIIFVSGGEYFDRLFYIRLWVNYNPNAGDKEQPTGCGRKRAS